MMPLRFFSRRLRHFSLPCCFRQFSYMMLLIYCCDTTRHAIFASAICYDMLPALLRAIAYDAIYAMFDANI